MIKVYLGTKGLKESWQDEFREAIRCPFCSGEAHVAFTVCEDVNQKKKEKTISELWENVPGIWPHDLIAASVYICSICGKGSVDWNQA